MNTHIIPAVNTFIYVVLHLVVLRTCFNKPIQNHMYDKELFCMSTD